MSDNENIKDAEKEYEYLTGDEEIRRLAYLREKAIRDEAAAMTKARREGKEEGKEEGREEATRETAKKMYEKGIDVETIEEITGLTKEEISNL